MQVEDLCFQVVCDRCARKQTKVTVTDSLRRQRCTSEALNPVNVLTTKHFILTEKFQFSLHILSPWQGYFVSWYHQIIHTSYQTTTLREPFHTRKSNVRVLLLITRRSHERARLEEKTPMKSTSSGNPPTSVANIY